jgi:hypothetical protein
MTEFQAGLCVHVSISMTGNLHAVCDAGAMSCKGGSRADVDATVNVEALLR